jgi:hypothetical protein
MGTITVKPIVIVSTDRSQIQLYIFLNMCFTSYINQSAKYDLLDFFYSISTVGMDLNQRIFGHLRPVAEFIVPDWGDKVDPGCRKGPQGYIAWQAVTIALC